MPKIGRGTGKEQAEACLSTLNDWGLQNRVLHPCQQYRFEERCVHFHCKRELAWVACHHHVMELPLPAVFSSLFGSTGGPYFAMLRRFQQTWPSIDHTTSYKVASDDMFDSHTSRTNGAILQGSLGRAASKR